MTVKTKPYAPPIPYRKMGEIDYDGLDFDPYESVEKPDAMEQHREQLAMLNLLDAYFSDFGKSADVFVDFDSNICYDPNDLRRHVSPDVYIVFGVDAEAIRSRRIYLPWEAGKPPDFAMEIASSTTAREDVERKPAIYESIGVPEYWMHDATGGRYYGEPLRGRKLVNGKYQDIELTREPDGILKGYSEVFGSKPRVGRRRPAPLRPCERQLSRKRRGNSERAARGDCASGRGGDAAGRFRGSAGYGGVATRGGSQSANRGTRRRRSGDSPPARAH